MQWLLWLKEFFEMLGGVVTFFWICQKIIVWFVKLSMIVSERKLKLNGSTPRTDTEKAFHERDDEHSFHD